MPRFSRITKKMIQLVVDTDDLNEGLYVFQNAIGIDSGDVAANVFAGPLEDEWPKASPERRHEMMAQYINAERFWAGP